MTCSRDILSEDALEREFESIRKVFGTLKKEELPLRMEWGTKEAFEKAIIYEDLPNGGHIRYEDTATGHFYRNKCWASMDYCPYDKTPLKRRRIGFLWLRWERICPHCKIRFDWNGVEK